MTAILDRVIATRRGCAAPRRASSRRMAAALAWLLLWVLPAAGALAAQAASPGGAHGAALERLLHDLAGAPEAAKLAAVNRFFNALAYRSDQEVWGRADRWTTPAELLSRGAGDCEDLAIAKYFALRWLGVPASALHLAYVRDLNRPRPHMVLLHGGLSADAMVLDSRGPALRTVADHPELVPVYGFNESQVTVFSRTGPARTFPHAGRWVLKAWQAVLRRVVRPQSAPGSMMLAMVRGAD